MNELWFQFLAVAVLVFLSLMLFNWKRNFEREESKERHWLFLGLAWLLLGSVVQIVSEEGRVLGGITNLVGIVLWVSGLRKWLSKVDQERQNLLRLDRENRELVSKIANQIRKTNEILAEKEQLLIALEQHAIVSISDSYGGIIYINEKFKQVSQYDPIDVLGQDHRILNSGLHVQAFFTNLWDTVIKGNVWQGTFSNRRKDGSIYWVDATVVPFMGSDGKLNRFVSIQTDITRRKEAEEKLLRQQGELEETVRERTEDLAVMRDQALAASQAKSVFLATMSHEIRTPLNVVLGMLELLGHTPLEAQHREYVDLAFSSGKRLLVLINDILDLSKIEAGQFTLDSVDFDLRDLLDDVTRSLAPLAQGKSLELTAFFPVQLPSRVCGDPNRLSQIFTNLIGNAIKFTPAGGSVELYGGPVGGSGKSTEFLFEVRDTGIGIPVNEREKVFSRFFQADGSNTRQFGGTGLGLSICQHLVAMMKGEIQVDINPYSKSGSVFYFTIQLEMSNFQDVVEHQDMIGLRVLVVASRGLQLTMLQDFLESRNVHAGYMNEIAQAETVLMDAVKKGLPYHLVLLNHQPGMGISEFLDRFRQNGFGVPRIILLTDLLESAQEKNNIHRENVLCLQKPFSISRLQTVIDAARNALEDQTFRTINSSGQGDKQTLFAQENRDKTTKTILTNYPILVVDDQIANLKVAEGMLVQLGADPELIFTVTDGFQAVEICQRQRFEIVIMDCQMPVMDGYQATRAIRKMEKNLHLSPTWIIAFTADITREGREACQKCGMNDFMSKPVTRALLASKLEQFFSLSASTEIIELPPEKIYEIVPPPDQEDVNVENAMQSLGLEPEHFVEVVEVIIAQLPELIENLVQDVHARDQASARAKAHILKGSMANVLFPQLKQPTETLHHHIRQNDWEQAKVELDRLIAAYEPIHRALRLFEQKTMDV
ncbi:MAG: ATP-binding protein [Magnetococcus sp. DMHC-6]